MSAEPRVAYVTGGNRGMGLETCRRLGQLGLRVVLTARDGAKADEAAGALRDEGLDVLPFELDVSDPEGAPALADFARSEVGRADVLVNNAGVIPDSYERPSVFDTSWEVVRTAMETNALGSLFASIALAPLMRDAGYGRIVNVSSGMGQLSEMGVGFPGYRMSKAALNATTRILSRELDGSGVLVNSVCPGFVRTDMGGPHARLSVEEGVDTTVWLATLPDDGPTGGFFRNREPLDW